jgi:hypothetical protein
MTSKRGAESRRRNEIKPIRLVDHALDRQPVVADGEVDDRLCRARDRNTAAEADLAVAQGRAAVNPQLWVTTKSRRPHGHLHTARLLEANAKERRSAAMAEHSPIAAVEDGGHPATLLAEVRSPNGIDTPSDQVQSAASKSMLDRLGAEAQVEELRPRNDSMLLPCEPPNRRPPPLAISRLFD